MTKLDTIIFLLKKGLEHWNDNPSSSSTQNSNHFPNDLDLFTGASPHWHNLNKENCPDCWPCCVCWYKKMWHSAFLQFNIRRSYFLIFIYWLTRHQQLYYVVNGEEQYFIGSMPSCLLGSLVISFNNTFGSPPPPNASLSSTLSSQCGARA